MNADQSPSKNIEAEKVPPIERLTVFYWAVTVACLASVGAALKIGNEAEATIALGLAVVSMYKEFKSLNKRHEGKQRIANIEKFVTTMLFLWLLVSGFKYSAAMYESLMEDLQKLEQIEQSDLDIS